MVTPMKHKTPFLSVVATSRNDDHGGDALWRTQHFVDGLVSQAEKHKIDLELILVDWNPVPKKEGLYKALKWPKQSQYFKKRVITVPKTHHDQFKSSGALPLFQYLAKNVGIRRAQGKFILSTNIDILFSDEVFESFKSLKEGVSYRALRYDILPKHMKGHTFRDILKNITEKGIRAHLRFYTSESKAIIKALYLVHHKLLGASAFSVLFIRLSMILICKLIKSFSSFLLSPPEWSPKKFVTMWKKYKSFFKRIALNVFMQNIVNYYVYTNASGDFTLMSKKDWFRLHGYPEFEMYSWHIDSLFLYQAYFQNIKTKVFPQKACIYHIEHGTGSGWTPDGEDLLFGRLKKNGIDFLINKDLSNFFVKQRHKTKHLFNDANWGAIKETFKEQS